MLRLQVCILGVCLIARPQLETDKHKAHLHLVGIIVGLFQAFFSGAFVTTSHMLSPWALSKIVAHVLTGSLNADAADSTGVAISCALFYAGTAKMCVRELRSSEAPNVIVFYLAFISSLGALTGVVGQVLRFIVLNVGLLQVIIVMSSVLSFLCSHKLMLRLQAEGITARW